MPGLRTTATMMYGTVETLEERLEHLFRLRDLQDETGGFTAFIAWSFQPDHTELGRDQGVTTEATGIDYLRTLAIARLVLDNFDNLQSSWVTQGGKVGQLSLAFGANDMGSVMIEENVVRAAGAAYCMDEVEIVRNIEDAGFTAKRRNMHYEVLGDPIFRLRDVPRMLELATARAAGDSSVPAELSNYAARSRAGKTARLEQYPEKTSDGRGPALLPVAIIERMHEAHRRWIWSLLLALTIAGIVTPSSAQSPAPAPPATIAGQSRRCGRQARHAWQGCDFPADAARGGIGDAGSGEGDRQMMSSTTWGPATAARRLRPQRSTARAASASSSIRSSWRCRA